jgi:hypothetical protein
MGTLEILRAESIRSIVLMFDCSFDEAAEVLKSGEDRRLIEASITPGRELDARESMPIAQWKWAIPSTPPPSTQH